MGSPFGINRYGQPGLLAGRLTLASLLMAVALSYGCKQSTGPEETIVPSAYIQTRASWSPDGKTIAFRDETAGKAGVYLVDTSGANVRLLVAGDGTLWVMRSDGSGKRRLTFP
jgi:hypothetical protein